MITFIRWMILKQKEIKWKRAFCRFMEKQLKELALDPEALEKKLLPSLAELIHGSVQDQSENG